MSPGVTKAIADSSGILTVHQSPQVSRKEMRSGFSVLARAQPAFLRIQFEKVKAHQNVDELQVGTRDWYVAKGNEWADRMATAAAATIPGPSTRELEVYDDTSKRLNRCLRFAAEALSLWAPLAPQTWKKGFEKPSESTSPQELLAQFKRGCRHLRRRIPLRYSAGPELARPPRTYGAG